MIGKAEQPRFVRSAVIAFALLAGWIFLTRAAHDLGFISRLAESLVRLFVAALVLGTITCLSWRGGARRGVRFTLLALTLGICGDLLFNVTVEIPAFDHVSMIGRLSSSRPVIKHLLSSACIGGLFLFVFQMHTGLVASNNAIEKQTGVLQAIFNSTDEGLVVVDENGEFTHFNFAAERILGLGASTESSERWSEYYGLYHSDQKTLYPATELPLARAMQGEESREVEIFIRNSERPKGFWCSVNAGPLRDETGAIRGGTCTFRDITKRKKAEQLLRENRDLLIAVFEGSTDAIYVKDLDGRYLMVNSECARVMGKTVGEIVGKTDAELFSPEVARDIMRVDLEIMEAREPRTIEEFVNASDSTFRTYLSMKAPLRNNQGQVTGLIGISRDITDRKRAVQALAETNALLEATFAYLADALIVVAPKDQTIISSNSAFERVFGYAPEEIIGRNAAFLYADEAAYHEVGSLMPPVLESDGRYQAEIVMRRKDGSIFDAEHTIAGVLDDAGCQTAFVSIIRDVSERKQAEQQLRESRAEAEELRNKLVEAIESLTEGFALYDADDRLVICNSRYREIYQESEDLIVVGASFKDHIRISASRGQVADALGREEEWVRERVEQHQNPQGSYLQQLGNGRWLQITEHKTIGGGIVGVRTDITERKRAEDLSRMRERQANVIAELGQQALAGLEISELLDRTAKRVAETLRVEYCKVLELNPDGQSFLLRAGVGWKENVVGQVTVPVATKSQAGFTLLQEAPVIVDDVQTETRFAIPQLFVDHGIISGISVAIGESEAPYGVLGAHSSTRHEFTEDDANFLRLAANVIAEAARRSKIEKALKDINATLEERVVARTQELTKSNTQLDAFAYSVAHDLRAPVRAMSGFASILLDDYSGQLGDDAIEMAGRIVASAERMNQLIQGLLEYSRIGRQKLELPPVDLSLVVREALAQLESELEQRNVKPDILGIKHTVLAHRASVVQIVVNLLGNALKFVEPDTIPHIKIWSERHERRVFLWVEDNGIGIDPEYHDIVFGVFDRLHGEESYSGMGIGLAIARRAAEAQGGHIGLESSLGEGCKFWLDLSAVE